MQNIVYENTDLANENHLKFLRNLWRNKSNSGLYFSYFGMAFTFKAFKDLLSKYSVENNYLVKLNDVYICWILSSVYLENEKKVIELSVYGFFEDILKVIYIINDYLINSDADEARLSTHYFNEKVLNALKTYGFKAYEKKIWDRQKYFKLNLHELKNVKIYEIQNNIELSEKNSVWPDDDSDVKLWRR